MSDKDLNFSNLSVEMGLNRDETVLKVLNALTEKEQQIAALQKENAKLAKQATKGDRFTEILSFVERNGEGFLFLVVFLLFASIPVIGVVSAALRSSCP